MIQIKVIQSPDFKKIGTVAFNKNLIYIGNSHHCDLFIKDRGTIANHLIIEIIEGKILVHPHKDIEYILVDGKRTKAKKILTVGNKIKIGETEFVIENSIETPPSNYKDYLNSLTDELINTDSPLLEIIQEIQKTE